MEMCLNQLQLEISNSKRGLMWYLRDTLTSMQKKNGNVKPFQTGQQ